MHFSVSTKMERAWYVNPDLWTDQGDDGPARVEIDAAGTTERDATMTLGEADLEEAEDLIEHEGLGRCYREVSLQGALIAPEDPFGLPVRAGGLGRVSEVASQLLERGGRAGRAALRAGPELSLHAGGDLLLGRSGHHAARRDPRPVAAFRA